jgi:hypothetical protein
MKKISSISTLILLLVFSVKVFSLTDPILNITTNLLYLPVVKVGNNLIYSVRLTLVDVNTLEFKLASFSNSPPAGFYPCVDKKPEYDHFNKTLYIPAVYLSDIKNGPVYDVSLKLISDDFTFRLSAYAEKSTSLSTAEISCLSKPGQIIPPEKFCSAENIMLENFLRLDMKMSINQVSNVLNCDPIISGDERRGNLEYDWSVTPGWPGISRHPSNEWGYPYGTMLFRNNSQYFTKFYVSSAFVCEYGYDLSNSYSPLALINGKLVSPPDLKPYKAPFSKNGVCSALNLDT